MFRFIESFDYDSGFYEVWFDTITKIYLVNELVKDTKLYFTNRTHYRQVVNAIENEWTENL